jgi:hypothetical protein
MKFAKRAKSFVKKIKGKHDHVIVLSSAHKVGSTWVFNVLRHYFDLKRREIPENLRKKAANPWIIDLQKDESIEWLTQLKGNYIIKSHTMLPDNTKNLKNIEFISVMRDPRDLMISSIYYLANLEPEKGGWPWLNSMSFQEMIFEWLEKNKVDYSLLLYFHQLDYFYKFYYEKLLINDFKEFSLYLRKQKHPYDTDQLKTAIAKYSFENVTDRKKGEENVKSFYRKGIANDWKNYFNKDIKKYFKKIDDGKWNRLLIDLGYEKDSDW